MGRLLVFIFTCTCTWAADGFVSLMPKKNLAEHWIVDGKAPAEAWTLRDGVIACTGQPNGFLRSRKAYRNYILRAEWRFQPGWEPRGKQEWPNAGFFIHAHEVENGWPKSLEVQGYFGEAGSLFGVRGGKITGAKRGPFVPDRPAFGSWDKYEITSADGNIKVVLNGVLVNEGTGAMPADGNICLQSEGWPVYYRNVSIKELK
jgi:3-keto-disaccharide hydrolase